MCFSQVFGVRQREHVGGSALWRRARQTFGAAEKVICRFQNVRPGTENSR